MIRTDSMISRTFLTLTMAASLYGCAPFGSAEQIATDNAQSDDIIGGSNVSSNDAISKSTVALIDLQKGSLCTGSLLSNNIILTAAHCVSSNSRTMVAIFDVNAEAILNQAQSLEQLLAHPKVRAVEKAVVSSSWAAQNLADKDTGDIAIMKISKAAPSGYRAASLLSDRMAIRNGSTVTLAGYGITDGQNQTGTAELRQVKVKVADINFSKTEVKVDQTAGRGACHGDSGGPAFVNIKGQNLLWGVTSRGINDPSNDCSRYAAYTNALAYTAMIKAAMTELNKK